MLGGLLTGAALGLIFYDDIEYYEERKKRARTQAKKEKMEQYHKEHGWFISITSPDGIIKGGTTHGSQIETVAGLCKLAFPELDLDNCVVTIRGIPVSHSYIPQPNENLVIKFKN